MQQQLLLVGGNKMNNKIKISNDQGESKEYDLLFSFDSKNTGKKYITYTDYKKDENGNIMCYSSIYDNGKIEPVTTKEELDTIDMFLRSIENGIKAKYIRNNE